MKKINNNNKSLIFLSKKRKRKIKRDEEKERWPLAGEIDLKCEGDDTRRASEGRNPIAWKST